MRSNTALGRTLRSAETNCGPTPAGERRRPLSSTSVRCEPRPRRPTVLTPGPPSETYPRKVLLIWAVPDVTFESCKISATEREPTSAESALVITVTGDAVLKLLVRMRDPVTT